MWGIFINKGVGGFIVGKNYTFEPDINVPNHRGTVFLGLCTMLYEILPKELPS